MWSLGGFDVIWVRGKIVSNGWRSARHAKLGALNVFFYVVMKDLMFLELVSGVKYPKITTVGFALKRSYVDVSSSCCSLLLPLYLFCWVFIFVVSGILSFVLWEKFCVDSPPSYIWIGAQGWTSKIVISSSSFPIFNPAQPHMGTDHRLIIALSNNRIPHFRA